MKSLLDWLFPPRREVLTVVVVDCPKWTRADAAELATFLERPAGRKLIGRMQHELLGLCMQAEQMDANQQGERRAYRMVIAGIEGHALPESCDENAE